jgi:hypothetical protein
VRAKQVQAQCSVYAEYNSLLIGLTRQLLAAEASIASWAVGTVDVASVVDCAQRPVKTGSICRVAAVLSSSSAFRRYLTAEANVASWAIGTVDVASTVNCALRPVLTGSICRVRAVLSSTSAPWRYLTAITTIASWAACRYHQAVSNQCTKSRDMLSAMRCSY